MGRMNDKKRKNTQAVVNELISAYRENGKATDPDGMYTGVPQAVQGVSVYPSAQAPTSAVPDGKRYQSIAAPVGEVNEPGLGRIQPQQDADDL